jgi:hypothetical protein
MLVISGEKVEVTVFGTAEGVRSDPQIGRRLDSQQIDETPILGRKASTVPLLNSAFRQAKGTGDLFVNQTYFVTGAGSRRRTTTTLDGANNDEAKLSERVAVLLRLEGFNLLNHGNFLGRGQTIDGDTGTPNSTFGQFVSGVGTATNAIPAFANIDPPRMFQV